MRKVVLFLAIAIPLVACESNTSRHLISDTAYRQSVDSTFNFLYERWQPRLPEVFAWAEDPTLSPLELEAMRFLYVSMPLSDLVNRDADFYLTQVRAAFKTRELFSWAKDLPEDVFRHFVLPYRINNENMDSARLVFQKELYPRIKDMTMEQAALEVNHWCHEKVCYRATDSRTISPLNAIKTAYGRCGEESTFTVTALRAVGIPARQVYTPRWAHTDDNHAWVEAYVDGKWQYFGACEPKPLLNTAWFDEPVLRAMMVHTNAFGKYFGSEPVLKAKDRYSVLHLLSNYVEVKELVVYVIDKQGNPVPEADIAFGLYNYAEFYPLKKAKTDAQGYSSLVSGLGSLRLTATDHRGYFNTLMVNLSDTDTCQLVLDKKIGSAYTEQIMYVPPVQQLPKAVPTDKEEDNNKRLAEEDSIRQAYESSFYTKEKAFAFLKQNAIQDESVADILVEARGNYAEIEAYLQQAMSVDKDYALPLLQSLAKKDYHDISANTLLSHLKAFTLSDKELQTLSSNIVKAYVLNPRISSEEITDYRAGLQAYFTPIVKGNTAAEISANLQYWIEQHIEIDPSWNYYRLLMHPVKVCQIGIADKPSRNLLYVAAMRSLGYAARIEQARNQPQYYHQQQWVDVNFATKEEAVENSPKASLSLIYKATEPQDPRYRIHFALAKFNGRFFETLEYDWEKPLSDFEPVFQIEAGYYQLLTGNRLHDGRVLVNQQFFNVKEGEHYTAQIQIAEADTAQENIGIWKSYKAKNKRDIEIVGWINPLSEPGKHFLSDFKTVADEYAKNKQYIHLYVATEVHKNAIEAYGYTTLQIEVDKDLATLATMYQDLGIEEAYMLPIFVIVGQDKMVRMHTKGYNIGTPTQLLKYVQK